MEQNQDGDILSSADFETNPSAVLEIDLDAGDDEDGDIFGNPLDQDAEGENDGMGWLGHADEGDGNNGSGYPIPEFAAGQEQVYLDMLPRVVSELNCRMARSYLVKLLRAANEGQNPAYGNPDKRPPFWPQHYWPWEKLTDLHTKPVGMTDPLNYSEMMKLAIRAGYEYFGYDPDTYINGVDLSERQNPPVAPPPMPHERGGGDGPSTASLSSSSGAPAPQLPPPPPRGLPPLLPRPASKLNCVQARTCLSKLLRYQQGGNNPVYGSPDTKPPWWPEECIRWCDMVDLRGKPPYLPDQKSYTDVLRLAINNCLEFHGLDSETYYEEENNFAEDGGGSSGGTFVSISSIPQVATPQPAPESPPSAVRTVLGRPTPGDDPHVVPLNEDGKQPPRLPSRIKSMTCATIRAALSKLLWHFNDDKPPQYGFSSSIPPWWPSHLMDWTKLRNLRHRYEGPLGDTYTNCLRKALVLGYAHYGLDPDTYLTNSSEPTRPNNDEWAQRTLQELEERNYVPTPPPVRIPTPPPAPGVLPKPIEVRTHSSDGGGVQITAYVPPAVATSVPATKHRLILPKPTHARLPSATPADSVPAPAPAAPSSSPAPGPSRARRSGPPPLVPLSSLSDRDLQHLKRTAKKRPRIARKKQYWFPPLLSSPHPVDQETRKALMRSKVTIDPSTVENHDDGEDEEKKLLKGSSSATELYRLDRAEGRSANTDLKMVSGSDGAELWAHKTVAAAQSDRVKMMVAEASEKGETATMVFAEMGKQVLEKLTDALYTGEAEVPADAMEAFQEGLRTFQRLGLLCELWVRSTPAPKPKPKEKEEDKQQKEEEEAAESQEQGPPKDAAATADDDKEEEVLAVKKQQLLKASPVKQWSSPRVRKRTSKAGGGEAPASPAKAAKVD